ncbi:hypothetical protein [Caballeronia sp. BR00000012568055]|uniref:hypothetical protein n=1 Tax=Caballeronia sp. BR00000012568055 TaxID=2918761 RepID=UPI0023F95A32|nr:hypothetical protein [Caballeronia sp. BR00000012568055]
MHKISIELIKPFIAFLKNAVTAHTEGRVEAGETWLNAAAHLHATDDDSLIMLVEALAAQSAVPDALAIAESWRQLRPRSVAAAYYLGCLFDMSGRQREALTAYRHALACSPDYPNLRTNLASAIHQSGGDLREAIALLEDACKADPQETLAWSNLCILRFKTFDLDGALIAGKRAVELAPHHAASLYAYALVLAEARRIDEATAYAVAACNQAPHDASYRFHLSILRLAQRDYEQGWPEFESRWRGAHISHGQWPEFPQPRWEGQPLDGKTLLLWGEQGMGDVLQFCRLVPALAQRVHEAGGRIEWNAFPQMSALLARSLSQHVDGFTIGGGLDDLPHYDYHLPLLSIPLVTGLRDETIPAAPYLFADAAHSAFWKQRLSHERRFKVGLVWTGSATHSRNPFRRVGWERYAEYLKNMPGVAFYSLQKGAEADVRSARAAGLHMEDFTHELNSFDDTAAFVGALDLVITVCTSIAHLGGALGCPTWVLLDVNPYWVWQLDRADTPWYSSVRLYRQPQFADWNSVMQDVAADLLRLTDSHR